MLTEVSIIIPIKDETDTHVGQCLKGLKMQKYDGLFEILVVKGGNRAQARNFGIRVAKGEIIAFIDSDCVAPQDWLSSLVSRLKTNKTLGGVGGVNFSAPDRRYLSKAIDFVFSSYLGSLGSASLHVPSKPKFVNALACINSAFWRRTLEEIGGFDEEFELCEDTNLSYKVRKAGYKLLFDPEIFVWHHRRDTLRGFAEQFFSYGRGRMQSILTDRAYASKSVIIPFLGALIFPLFAWLFPLVCITALSIYFVTIFIKGLQGAIKAQKWHFILLIPLLFMIEHLSYFFGLIYGVLKGGWKSKEGKCEVFYHTIVQKTVD